MNWLKKKIRDWLGITQLQNEYNLLDKKYDKLYKEYRELKEIHEAFLDTHKALLDNYKKLNKCVDTLIDQNTRLENRNRELSQRNEFILKNFQIAVDHNPYENQSWAVVCINGQPQYVNFLSLRHAEAREIMHYLKNYDKGQMVVDSPHRTMKLDIFRF